MLLVWAEAGVICFRYGQGILCKLLGQERQDKPGIPINGMFTLREEKP